MATGTGPCRSAPANQSHQSPDELGEDDLNVVLEALHPVAAKYMFLGVAMKVKMNEIKKIQKRCSDHDECLLEVLSVRLKQIPPLTWRDIDTALRSDTVGEPQLADRIRRQYGHLYTPDPSFEASLDQEQGRKMSSMTKSKKKTKKEKPSRKYTKQDSDEEVSESERYRKPSKKLQMDVNEAVVKKIKQKAKKCPYIKRHPKPEKQYIEKESKHRGETQRKKKATKYDKESQVVCGSQHRHKVKHSEQRAQKEVQIESESESFASSCSEQEIVRVDNSDSTEESYSLEQEEDSAEEVSETERYQKPSERPKVDEYPHSHRETHVRMTKGKIGRCSDLEKSKFESQSKPEAKAKQKKKEVDQSVSKASQHEMPGDVHGKHKKVVREHKQKKSGKHSKKGVQKAPRENESESSAMRREEERVSSSYHRGKSRKPISAKDLQQKQSQGEKLEYQTKPTAKKDVYRKGKGIFPVAKEQSSDEEVREKPAPKSLRQKEEQTNSESEDESSASTSDDQNELIYESTVVIKHHKMHPNTDVNEIEKERAVRIKKKTKVTKQKHFCCSDTDMREQRKEGKTSTKVNQKTSKEKYLKADTSLRKERREQAEKEKISSKKKVVERDTPSSDSTQEDSEEEESDSDDSSEDEEDRDSEQKSSNEEEETEPDDESFPDISEEEVKRKPSVPYMKERVKEIGGTKGKRVKIAADIPHLPGDEDQADPGGRDQEEHDIQPKKRSRRRHRESSMSPTARGSSSPSTSQEENQNKEEGKKQPDPKRRKKTKEQGVDIKQENVRRKEEENMPSSSDTDDSSPECDMRSLTEEECKKLKKVYKRFFGKLCCAIVNPVETAAQLQEKRLISQSIMKDLIMSPESQQSKTISVVGLISKKIGAHPDRLFLFIDILLDYDAPQLQRVGREMLTEAGNLTLISTVKLL